MKKLVLSSMASIGLLMAMPDTASAHGGQYRGPGDVVPPNPGSGGGGRTPGPTGPTSPGPSGPSGGGPAGPSTPGPAGPAGPAAAGPTAGPAGPTTARGGVQAGPDLTKWQFWWEFNKDPFINLKAAIHTTGTVTESDDFFMGAGKVSGGKDTMKPTEQTIMNQVLPRLKQALDGTSDRDITSSCIVAMAKIGKDHPNFKILEIFKEHLTSGDQEIRETAAVSMGISQMTDAVNDLAEMVKDSPAGRKLTDRGEVDPRTRSFAAYGLGLVSYATADVDIKTAAFEALKSVLEDESIVNRNPKVAAINGISLLNPDISDPKSTALLNNVLTTLETYFNKDLGTGEQQIQSHVPPAIAKLLQNVEGDSDLSGKKEAYKKMFLNELNGRSKVKRSSNEVVQSSALALGQMAKPYEEKGSPDADISRALNQYFEKGKDQQAKYFSLLALGQIGGKENRSALLKALEKGNKALEKPWAAIGLGVYSFDIAQADPSAEPDTVVGRALQDWLGKLKNPDSRSAIAVALGLAKYIDSADDLRTMMIEEKNQDELAGYLAIGLALMNDQRSIEDIKNIVKTSVRRPDRLKQAAIALGKLGDKSVTELLQGMMTEGGQNLAKMSAIASALGFIGDRRTIDPLTKMLFDESITPLSRAFAAVALGGVADKELLPWNSKIAQNMNYRAAVETLTNGQAGILDIL